MSRQLTGPIGTLVAEVDIDLDQTARRNRAGEVDGRVTLLTDVAVAHVHIVAVTAIATALLCNDQNAPAAVVGRGCGATWDTRQYEEQQEARKEAKRPMNHNTPRNDESLI